MSQSTAGVPVLRNLVFPSPEEIDVFEKMFQKDFYTSLMEAAGLQMDRKVFKRAFLRFLYKRALTRYNRPDKNAIPVVAFRNDGTCYEEKIREPVRMTMEAILPSITHFLDICKCRPGTLDNRWNYYKWMARAIQKIESQIMLEVCNNLWKKYPTMFLVTLHDAIKCLPKDADKVQKELTRTFAKYHVAVKSDVDSHTRPSGVNG